MWVEENRVVSYFSVPPGLIRAEVGRCRLLRLRSQLPETDKNLGSLVPRLLVGQLPSFLSAPTFKKLLAIESQL
jgi:hypothetical protein